MSKIIGITPGPVEFTNLDNEDLAAIKQFNPSNTGSAGQVLTKKANGYDWETANGMTDNAMLGFYSSFDCETNDNYQGSIPIDPESTMAGSICVKLYCVNKKIFSSGSVSDLGTYTVKVSLVNNGEDVFEGSTNIMSRTDMIVSLYVRLTPSNVNGTISYNTIVRAWILVKYSITDDGTSTFEITPTTDIPQIVSGCANAES